MVGRIVNDNRNSTSLIERYIGTAFDTVKLVAGYIPLLEKLVEEIEEINDSWLGNLPEAPTINPETGNPIEEGARYYNTTTRSIYVYTNGTWVNPESINVAQETIIVEAGMIQAGKTVITLSGSYTPNTNAVAVYIEGARQFSRSVDPVNGGFEETDSQTITVLEELGIGETVLAVVGTEVNVLNPIVTVETGRVLISAGDTYAVGLPNGMTYQPGSNNLSVYKNGILKEVGYDYSETSPTSVTFLSPLQPGDVALFKIGDLVANYDNSNDCFTAIATYASFYEYRDILDKDAIVLVRGGYVEGDGLGSVFTYSETAQREKANGVTLVDPTLPFLQQGQGVGVGCWSRNYDGEIFPQWFNSYNGGIDALLACKGLNEDMVRILGFYGFSNIGGGTFIWYDNVPSELHNGGVVISPLVNASPGTPAWFTPPPAGTFGCWIRVQDFELIDMRWFGIKQGPFADNGPSLQAAVDYAQGKAILLPSGDIRTDQAIIGNFCSYGPVNVIGTGAISTIKNLLA